MSRLTELEEEVESADVDLEHDRVTQIESGGDLSTLGEADMKAALHLASRRIEALAKNLVHPACCVVRHSTDRLRGAVSRGPCRLEVARVDEDRVPGVLLDLDEEF